MCVHATISDHVIHETCSCQFAEERERSRAITTLLLDQQLLFKFSKLDMNIISLLAMNLSKTFNITLKNRVSNPRQKFH